MNTTADGWHGTDLGTQAIAWSTVCTRHACMQAPHVRQADHPASYACMSREPGASVVNQSRFSDTESLPCTSRLVLAVNCTRN